MRCSTTQHPFSCGIDLHARTMSVCILNRDGEIRVHRHMQAGPDPLLKAMAPYRQAWVVCVACLFTWYGLADLCARAGMPCVLGHALYMKAIHGGQAKHDTSDAQKIAILLRGGMRPQASVYPADMRATRELLRRRIPRMRKRAARLAHIQNTHSPYTLPEIGKQRAYQANRDGVAERFPDPAVQNSMEGALALLGSDDQLLSEVALHIVQAAKQHNAQPLSLLQTGPGIGNILRLVLRDEMHDSQRLPRVQDFVSSCRLVKCARASAGQR